MDFDKDVAIKRLFNKIYLLYLDYKIKLESINNVAKKNNVVFHFLHLLNILLLII